MAKRIFMSSVGVTIPKSNTDNELRQEAISLLDKGRGGDIIMSEWWYFDDPFSCSVVTITYEVARPTK